MSEAGYQWDTQKKAVAHILRTRVEKNKADGIIRAHYTILTKEIRLIGQLAERPAMELHYWFNPNTNDRNLEFDISKNLVEE